MEEAIKAEGTLRANRRSQAWEMDPLLRIPALRLLILSKANTSMTMGHLKLKLLRLMSN